MNIISWNVNGIRSVFRNGFLDVIKTYNPDIICLQEIKADTNDFTDDMLYIPGYECYINSSYVKKGHAGVAVYTKLKPKTVETNLGIDRFDREGRMLKIDFDEFILFNLYLPHGSRDKRDMSYKLDVYSKLFPIIQPLSDKPVIFAGDFNIAHTDEDVYYAKQNRNNTMFTKEERQALTEFLGMGYVDTFREKHPYEASYTWWAYINNLRERDIGWRIDYFFVAKSLYPSIVDSFILKEVHGSDHCPIALVM